jgi:hypothetical protein
VSGSQIFQLTCISLSCVLLCVAAFYLRRAGRYIKITAKIRSGQPLTDRERAMLDRAKS